jgi:ATP-dependent DNA helicase RecG
MARLTDVRLLDLARKEAVRLFEVDPRLEQPEHKALASQVARLWENTADTKS